MKTNKKIAMESAAIITLNLEKISIIISLSANRLLKTFFS